MQTTDGRTDGQTYGHGDSSIPPLTSLQGYNNKKSVCLHMVKCLLRNYLVKISKTCIFHLQRNTHQLDPWFAAIEMLEKWENVVFVRKVWSVTKNFINFLSTKYGLCSAMSFAQVWVF